MKYRPTSLFVILIGSLLVLTSLGQAEEFRPPNIVLFFVDDMGYADIGPFGARAYPTPNLDKLALSGRRFTDFHVTAPVCSASRSALMTGCLNTRLGVNGA